MAKNIGCFPHHKALVVDEPKLLLLFGEKEKGRTPQKHAQRRINLVTRVVGTPEIDPTLKLKLPLTLPMSGLQNFESRLQDDDYEVVSVQINKISVIEAQIPENEDPRVQTFREKILKDYDGRAFRDKPFPDPPERGPYGYAYIQLKEGAQPQRQKPFSMHGERQEAFKKVLQD